MSRSLDPLPITTSSHISRISHGERGARRGFEGQPSGLHGWLLARAALRGALPQNYLFIVKKYLSHQILNSFTFGARSFCHLELGVLLKPVFPNIRFSIAL